MLSSSSDEFGRLRESISYGDTFFCDADKWYPTDLVTHDARIKAHKKATFEQDVYLERPRSSTSSLRAMSDNRRSFAKAGCKGGPLVLNPCSTVLKKSKDEYYHRVRKLQARHHRPTSHLPIQALSRHAPQAPKEN